MSAVLNDQRLASQTQGVEFLVCLIYFTFLQVQRYKWCCGLGGIVTYKPTIIIIILSFVFAFFD